MPEIQESNPTRGFCVASPSNSVYEHAEMSCMQAVASLSVALTHARCAAQAGNMTDCSSSLIQSARMADFLHEIALRDQIGNLHKAVFCQPGEQRVELGTLVNACKGLEIKWREMLRQNTTRYAPIYRGS